MPSLSLSSFSSTISWTTSTFSTCRWTRLKGQQLPESWALTEHGRMFLLLLLLLCQTHGPYGWVDPPGNSCNSKLKATVETARQQEVHKKVGCPSFRLGRDRHVGRQLLEQAVWQGELGHDNKAVGSRSVLSARSPGRGATFLSTLNGGKHKPLLSLTG